MKIKKKDLHSIIYLLLLIIKLELSSYYLNTEWTVFLTAREKEIAIILFQIDEVNPQK